MRKRSLLVAGILSAAMILGACGSAGTTQSTPETNAAESTVQEAAPEESQEAEAPAEQTAEGAVAGTYSLEVVGHDWGCGTQYATITFDKALDAVSKEDFTVKETKIATDSSQEGLPETEQTFDRVVDDAYFVDEAGEASTEPTNMVKLELYVSPSDGSPINYSMPETYNHWSVPYYLTIEKADGAALTVDGTDVDIAIETEPTAMETAFDDVAVDSFAASDGVTYEYAHYEPEEKSDTIVVWLHGGGEGGKSIFADQTDPRIILLANEAGNLMGEEFQTLVGGANILYPQSPSIWMATTKEFRGEDWAENDGTSYYLESLKELIDKYKEDTGASKVVLTGCSNGGFMSFLLAKTYPDAFTAIVPVCPPFKAEQITDEELEAVKDVPMFFIYSNNDDTVVPSVYEEPLIAKLKEAGASNLYVSTSEDVHDTNENIKTEDGSPYQYSGHFAWVYFFNNEAADDETGLGSWDFIKEQVQ